MRFLGTQDIALRAEKDALEQNIQKAGMSGAEKRDPQSVAKMRQRLSEIYTRLDPAKAVKEQVKANQGTRFNPAMGDYDPLNMNLETAMALVDRKYGNQPGYLKSRDQVKYSIQNQLSGGTPIDSASVVGRARDELTKATKKDPGGAKAATLESRRNLVDTQKTKASDLEGMTNPYDIAMTLMDLQNQGGMDRPIGGGMANRPNISPYGNSLPAQAMAAAGMVTDQMRPSESIPSTQGILGKEKGVQVDAFLKSMGSMFDPAQLATPITGAADMADMAFRALDPVARQQVEKELKGATKEEQDTFIARMLGMLTGGVIQGKIGAKLSSRLKSAADRPLPAPLEDVLTNMAANQGTKRNFLPEMKATQPVPDQIGLAQAASMKRPVKPRVEPIATPADFTVGQEIKVPKKNGSESAAKVTDVTDVSVGIETAAGVKKFYSPEDAKAILKPQENTATPRTPTDVVFETMSPDDIQVHPKMQFRGIAKSSTQLVDRNGNVTGEYKDVKNFYPSQAGPLLVWEAKDGKRFVVDGHHRLDMAKRADGFFEKNPDGSLVPQDRKLSVEVKREVDGWSAEQIQFEGVMRNLRDQKADPLDAAYVLRNRGFKPNEIQAYFKESGVKADGRTTQTIEGLLALDETTFTRALDNQNIDQKALAGVGTQGLSPRQQLAALSALEDERINTFKQGQYLGQAIKDAGEPVLKKTDDSGQGGFGDMFGDEFADYESTLATTVVLRSAAEGIVARRFKSLLEPIGMEKLDGEVINATGRKELASGLGKSRRDVTSKLDGIFRDNDFKEFVSQTARDVLNENITEAQGATRIAEEAARRISGQSEGEILRNAILGEPKAGGDGAVPPSEPPGARPGSPDPGQPKRVNPKQKRQAGKTDPKTLGAAAGAALTGAAFYFKDDINKAIEENDLEDIRNTLIKAGIGTALATVLFDKGRGAVIGATKNSFDPFRVILDPRSVEKLSATGPFKSSLADVLTVNDLYKLKSAKAMINVEKTAKDVFGKNPGKNPVYKEWNTKYRDHVEQNIANGKKWDDGVPEEFATFAKSAIKEMDTMLDEWEKLGGRIKVTNNGLQQTKMEIGASIKLATGEWAEYQGFSKLKDGTVKLQVEVVNAAGKKVLRDIAPGEEFGRPVYRMGEAYVPRIYTRSFIEQILKGDDAFKSALSEAVVKAGGDPLSDAEFTSLKDMARGFTETEAATDINSFMGNLQKERQLQFAKFEYTTPDGKKVVVDPYENSYFDAVRKYTDRAAKRVAVAEVLGVESDVLAKVIDGVRGVDYDGANYLTSLVGNLLDLGPKAPDQRNWMSKLARKEGQYQAVTKLLGGTSAISQFADIIIPLTEFGPKTVGRAIQKLVKDPTFKSDIDAFNGGTQAWVKEMTGVENTGGKGEIATAKFIDTGMAVVQLKQMDKTMKRINTASVVTQVEQIGKKIEAKQPLTGPESRMVDRLGMTKWVDAIKKDGLKTTMAKEKFQADIAGHAKTFQYSGAAEDLPQWMSHPVGAIAMRFKKPWYVATKTLMQGALNEASQGNFTPFARLVAYSVGVGAGAQYMKDIIKMSGLDDETRDLLTDAWKGADAAKFGEAIKRMFVDVPLEKNYLAQGIRNIREEKAGALMQLFGLVGQTIYESGSSGIAGEVLPINQRSQSDVRQFNSWDSFKPISYQSGMRIAGMVGAQVQKMGGTLTPEKADANTYEAFRSEVIPARRVFDLFNAKPDEVRAREDARKIKIENAKVPKDLPTKERNQILEGVATPEKVRRSIRNSIKSGKKLKL
jgi:hypothetical protein